MTRNRLRSIFLPVMAPATINTRLFSPIDPRVSASDTSSTSPFSTRFNHSELELHSNTVDVLRQLLRTLSQTVCTRTSWNTRAIIGTHDDYAKRLFVRMTSRSSGRLAVTIIFVLSVVTRFPWPYTQEPLFWAS